MRQKGAVEELGERRVEGHIGGGGMRHWRLETGKHGLVG